MIEETLTKVDGHYEIGILWKDKDIHLPNNRAVAELRRRLEQDAELKQRYTAAIKDNIIKGYAKQLTERPKKAQITQNLVSTPPPSNSSPQARKGARCV